jgi:DNA gyrase subunit B
MYIGDTDSKGMSHLLFEIVDNSVDEALAGYCTRIDVTVDPETNTASVADNGRGIPTGINTKTKLSGVTLAFTKLHAGGKFGGSGYRSAGGLHGVGAAVTNALSEMCVVEVRQDGKVHRVEFSRGVVGEFDAKGKFTAKKGADLKVVGKCPKSDTGTLVTFRPDTTVFAPGSTIDLDLVRERLRRTAFLVPGLTITLTAAGEVIEYRFDGGIKDLAEASASGTPLCPVIDINGTGTFTETVPVLQGDGSLKSDDVQRDVDVRVAIAPTAGYDTVVTSFVNIVNTSLGGTHVKGFEAGLLKWARANANLKAKDPALVLTDCLEGLSVVINVGFPEPQFTSQAKVQLGTTPVQGIVADVVAKGLTDWMNARGNKQPAKTLLDKIVTAAKVRVATKEERDTKRRKSALENGSSLPAKLVDCRSRDDAELLIVEGDSALGTAKAGRYASHQALLPIRGKILNAQKASAKQILDNAESAAIIQTLGGGSGRTFDQEQCRYERVILLADADVDGSHIQTLLIALFWNQMRPFVEAGRLFLAMPPLHRVKTTGRTPKDIFTYTHAEMESTVAALEKAGDTVKRPVQRYKGLGEMDADELRATTLDPRSRRLKRINATDAEAASLMLELLLGNAVEPRRDYLMANARIGDDL